MRHVEAVASAVALAVCGCGGGGTGADAGDGGWDADAVCSRDSECDDGLFCNGAERCMPASLSADRRGCVPAPDPCGEGQTCDEDAGLCLTDCDGPQDRDGDGHAAAECGGDDCDDSDPRRFPGNAEICDAERLDEDCDPTTIGQRDEDGDGAVSSACCNVQDDGSLECGSDCDDSDVSRRPGQVEVCDDADNDCDGTIDEDTRDASWHADADGDGFGAPGDAVESCSPVEGRSLLDTDCDDDASGVHPGAAELCDGADNDCDDTVDEGLPTTTWYVDDDGDAYGDETAPGVSSCAPLPGYSTRNSDCDDSDPKVSPVATERCNGGVDDDCDGMVDEGAGC